MKHLLFVDDDQGILDGLRRMLRSQRHEWKMSFANSGAEALQKMAEENYDVIVSDMQMPGMTGAELLIEVQKRYPGTARIILSGHSDMESSMRSVAVSHQFLTKPCDKVQLIRVVENACQLDDLLQQPSIVEALGTVSALPVVPAVYQELTQSLADVDVHIKKITEIVQKDLGVAAKILQLVNSSFFGLGREISNLQHAVAYLGVNTIRDLVLSFEMFQMFDGTTLPKRVHARRRATPFPAGRTNCRENCGRPQRG